ncbi:MAG: VOC family protein [Actinomycetota bacterium]
MDEAAVDRAAQALQEAGVEATEPRYYPEYDPGYYVTFFSDPDGVRLEITNFGERRRKLIMTGRQGPTSEGVRTICSPDEHPSTLVHEGVAHLTRRSERGEWAVTICPK